MPKIPLRIREDKPGTFKGGMMHSHIKSCFPFYQARAGAYVHRIRTGRVYWYRPTMECRHYGFEMWCGMLGSTSKDRPNSVKEFVPEGAQICAVCEGKAIGAGQIDSGTINGRPVIFQPRKDRPAKIVAHLPEMPITPS